MNGSGWVCKEDRTLRVKAAQRTQGTSEGCLLFDKY